MKFEAVNDTIILLKDGSGCLVDVNDMRQIPEPYTGTVDSVGVDNEWKPGDRIAFDELGGLYLRIDEREYVVITPDMIIGKF